MYKKLINTIEKENINYINHKLHNSEGMIAHYNDITAIIIDDVQVKTQTTENTVLLQELGHYTARCLLSFRFPIWIDRKIRI